MKRWIPALLTLAFGLWIATGFLPPKKDPRAIDEFGRLPLVFGGRVQPFDSLARNSLLQMRERHTVYDAKEKRTLSATEWLLELMTKPEDAHQRRVFRIMHPELQSMLNLPVEPNETTGDDGKNYSWNQISPGFESVRAQLKTMPEEASKRSVFQQALVKLNGSVTLYIRLQNTLRPMDSAQFADELKTYQAAIPAGVEAFRQRFTGQAFDTNALSSIIEYAQRYLAADQMESPLIIPPHHPEIPGDQWMRIGEALLEPSLPVKPFGDFVSAVTGQGGNADSAVAALLKVSGKGTLTPAVTRFAQMTDAYRTGNEAEFARLVAEHSATLATSQAKALAKAGKETGFNRFEPFYKALTIYIAVFLLATVFWFGFSEWARTGAVWLCLLALAVHSGGLIYRMLLEGRPPVTNLYSSAIFIGWGAVVLGLVLERFWRNAVGLAVSSVLGFSTLIIAHNLALGGDTMEMMRAVLDTNFWLATHVVIVTLGYASTYVAGFLAILYIVLGVFTPRLTEGKRTDTGRVTEPMGKSLTRMVYGIVCFATLFSFVGTVLGGIWADQSWGRFWGWDPKENGALIIVLWNALILHARWGGLVRDRGVANLAVFGNIVTAWSWFGTNMLGIGLHSYGFTDAAFRWLMIFVASQLAIIGLGFLPKERWRSFRGALPSPTPKGGDAPLPRPAKA
ncbi:MAG TPA: cytochrome c biogenesis protein CcsA [Candidatus Limnocylindria bacterium]|jgi:cytochrome c-type biogenesis protein CcsB|nr:cytochrome c biogenesis protein CcsA [Candidatus Limnocylindria bacterium]